MSNDDSLSRPKLAITKRDGTGVQVVALRDEDGPVLWLDCWSCGWGERMAQITKAVDLIAAVNIHESKCPGPQRWCCICKIMLPLELFHRDASQLGGLSRRCRECERIRDARRKRALARRRS